MSAPSTTGSGGSAQPAEAPRVALTEAPSLYDALQLIQETAERVRTLGYDSTSRPDEIRAAAAIGAALTVAGETLAHALIVAEVQGADPSVTNARTSYARLRAEGRSDGASR